MKNNRGWYALLLLVLVISVVNLFSFFQMKRRVEWLEASGWRMENNIQAGFSEIKSEMTNQNQKLEEQLQKDRSIFAETSVTLELREDKIAVSMYAMPKEMEQGEMLVAQVVADGQIYEQEMGEGNRTEILVDRCNLIKPSFIIKSDVRVRREVLEDISTQELFLIHISGNWLVEAFCVSIEEEKILPFEADDIESAEFIIVDSGIARTQPNSGFGWGGASSKESSMEEVAKLFDELQGERLTAIKMPGITSSGITYRVDLSEYISKKDGIYYEIYFAMETRDGTRYVSENPVASFSFLEGSRSTGGGCKTLRALLPAQRRAQ